MNIAASIGKIKQYSQVDRYTGVTEADPHQLVLMLLEGALGKIAAAKGSMTRNDIAKKGEAIGHAISIVGGLRSSLNMPEGGELAANLDDIYEYIERQLVKANIKNDTSILNEVITLLREVKIAWESISPEVKIEPEQDLTLAIKA